MRGATAKQMMSVPGQIQFQSTPPVRGATVARRAHTRTINEFQSTPPVRGATNRRVELGLTVDISIHAPRAGGDYTEFMTSICHGNFNPRPPCGGRRPHIVQDRGGAGISIHAPRAGGDTVRQARNLLRVFQSTPPVRGATRRPWAVCRPR